jgi:hypothetical protein
MCALLFALSIAGFAADSEPAAAAPRLSDAFRVYATGLPTPVDGAVGIGASFAPGHGAVRPLVGVEAGVAWFTTDGIMGLGSGAQTSVAPNVAAYAGAHFTARPGAATSFVADTAVGGIAMYQSGDVTFAPWGRFLGGVDHRGRAVEWDVMAGFELVYILPLPTVEVGVRL